MSHALVIGGTGMLANTTRTLAARGWEVSVVARGADAFCQGDKRLHAVCADWGDTPKALDAIAKATEARGPAQLALVWIHASPLTTPFEIARLLAAAGPVDFFHAMGSAVSDPARAARLDEYEAAFAAIPGLSWHAILLGFVAENGGSRWLTNEEIATGALAAIDTPRPRVTIGQTAPWSARPGGR